MLNDTKNRAETTYLNIFLSLKSGSFWVRDLSDKISSLFEFKVDYIKKFGVRKFRNFTVCSSNKHSNFLKKKQKIQSNCMKLPFREKKNTDILFS